jgi:hypothetical protein
MWSVRVDGKKVWRASLETTAARQREGFASLDELFGFLRQQTGMCSDQSRVGSEEVGDKAP